MYPEPGVIGALPGGLGGVEPDAHPRREPGLLPVLLKPTLDGDRALRGVDRVVSVRPVLDDGQGKVSAELARPTTDYLIVLQMPH